MFYRERDIVGNMNPQALAELNRRATKCLFQQGITVESWYQIYRHIEVTDWLIPWFFALGAHTNGGKVGEIGMRGGSSTVAFLMGVSKVNGHLWSMDIEPCGDAIRNIEAFGFSPWHTFMQGNSLEMDFPEPLDVLFIDGDHHYEGVKGDYDRHYPKVKSGGIILFHDTLSCPDDVGRLCEERGIMTIPYGKSGLGVQVKG